MKNKCETEKTKCEYCKVQKRKIKRLQIPKLKFFICGHCNTFRKLVNNRWIKMLDGEQK
jgi:hypothetical protein